MFQKFWKVHSEQNQFFLEQSQLMNENLVSHLGFAHFWRIIVTLSFKQIVQ